MTKKKLHEYNLIGLAIIGALILIFCTLMDFRFRVNKEIQNDMKNQIKAIAKNGVSEINNEMNYLQQLAETAAIFMLDSNNNSDTNIRHTLEEYSKSDHVDQALYISPAGKVYCSYTEKLSSSAEAALDCKSLQNISTTTFTAPWYSEKLKQVLFGIAVPLSSDKQSGVLISAYTPERFYTLFQSDFLGGSAEIALLNKDGSTILGRQTDDNKNQLGLDIIDSLIKSNIKFTHNSAEGMRQDMSRNKEGFSSYFVENTERYCFYAPVDYNDWYVIVLARESALRGQFIQLEQIGILLTLKLVLIMTLLLAVIIICRYKEEKRTEHELEKLASIDGLTGILNRRSVENEIIHYLEHDGKNKNSALILIDIDDFKNINDQYGHVAGDMVLNHLARHIENCFSQTDLIGRMGGDEFIILVKNYPDFETIQKSAVQLTAPISCKSSDTGFSFSISAGIALYPSDGTEFSELYLHADETLYNTKQNGKSSYTFYSDFKH